MKKVVLAIDSFKGCLTSAEAEEAAACGVHDVFPGCETLCLPMSDGGEGMLEAFVTMAGGRVVQTEAHDPLMRKTSAPYGLSADGTTAFIEMAAISGLPLVPSHWRNPLYTTTYGTGELIRDALERGCRQFVIGLGGSATNDAGLGMMQALGFRFLDAGRCEVKGVRGGLCGESLARVEQIDATDVHPGLADAHFVVACDVDAPFFGPSGAACVFAPQKGADERTVQALDAGLRHYSKVVCRCTGKDIARLPGAGAAGGLGGALVAFFHAELKPGIQLLLEGMHFTEHLRDADLVLTGEGRADRQTLMGKVSFGVLSVARKLHIPVVLVAGSVADVERLNDAGFQGVYSIADSSFPLEVLMRPAIARDNLRRTVRQICHQLKSSF